MDLPSFFPGWVRVTHVINILFISLMIRSGLQIFSAFPRLYLHDDCRPGNEWLKLTRSRVPLEDPDLLYRERSDRGETPRIHTSLDEELDAPSWLALPGHRELGLGRHWHFIVATFWMLNGFVYVAWVFYSGYWTYLIPQHWSIFPTAGSDIWTYLHLQLPPELPGEPFNAIQKLSYFVVIFIIAPLQIATAAAMSPAIAARFPWYISLFGGRQKARSLHFLSLVAFILFIIVHTIMVFWHGIEHELGLIIWGAAIHPTWSVIIAVLVLVGIAWVHWLATDVSLHHPRFTQRVLGLPMKYIIGLSLGWERSRQNYPRSDISSYFWVNGQPPVSEDYQALAKNGFRDWRLEVSGLVAQPLNLSLADLRAMPKQTQVTKHNCIQGWSDVGAWGGVPLRDLIEKCQPDPRARYVVFHAMDNKTYTEHHDRGAGGYFYETLSLRYALDNQTLLAYEFNGQPLPIPHGAPLRLRVETQLGFKMVKWLRAIELVADYQDVGEGQGGWREDHMYYDPEAGI